MDTKIFFNCGGERLVIKFEDATPILTIADDKCITLSNVGMKAFIHHNSSDNNNFHGTCIQAAQIRNKEH